MQNKPKTQVLLWWIIGGITVLGLISLGIYKLVQANKKSNNLSSNSVENNNKPNQTSPSAEKLPTPSKEQELEKYLLEKRLDLKRYFVFNLGQEVKPEVIKTNLLVNGQQVNMENGRLLARKSIALKPKLWRVSWYLAPGLPSPTISFIFFSHYLFF